MHIGLSIARLSSLGRVKGKDMCINIYDVRLDDEQPACGMNWPPDIKPITSYLGVSAFIGPRSAPCSHIDQRPDVVAALHASSHSGRWVECRGTIHSHFDEYKLNASITVLPKVLSKLPVLIFAGDQDLICNYVGLEAMMKSMTWNGGTGLGVILLFNCSYEAFG